jgi:hypothetical protein
MASSKITTFALPAIAALAAMLSSVPPVKADSADKPDRVISYCVYSYGLEICNERWGKTEGGFPRVIQVPAPRAEEAEERGRHERKWLARCHPVIKQDRYGVGRYFYAAPGCEFGKTED